MSTLSKSKQSFGGQEWSYVDALEHIKAIKPEAYVLLNSRVQNLYLQALTQAKWKNEVIAQYGQSVWQVLEEQRAKRELPVLENNHQIVSVDCEPLYLEHDPLTPDQIVKASHTMQEIGERLKAILNLIIDEAKEQLVNDDTFYKAYKAFWNWPDHVSEVDQESILPSWKAEQLFTIDQLETCLDKDLHFGFMRPHYADLTRLVKHAQAAGNLGHKYPERSYTIGYFSNLIESLEKQMKLSEDFDNQCFEWEALLEERSANLEKELSLNWDQDQCLALIQSLNNRVTLKLIYDEREQAVELLKQSMELSQNLVKKLKNVPSKKMLVQCLKLQVEVAIAEGREEEALGLAKESLLLSRSIHKASLKRSSMGEEMTMTNTNVDRQIELNDYLGDLADLLSMLAMLSEDEEESINAYHEQINIYKELYEQDESINRLYTLFSATCVPSLIDVETSNKLNYTYLELLKTRLEHSPEDIKKLNSSDLDHIARVINKGDNLNAYLTPGWQYDQLEYLNQLFAINDLSNSELKTLVFDVLNIAKGVLADEKQLRKAVHSYIEKNVEKKYELVVARGRFFWNEFGGRFRSTFSNLDSCLSPEKITRLINKNNNTEDLTNQEQNTDPKVDSQPNYEDIETLVKKLLKLPLGIRDKFVQTSLNEQLSDYHSIIRALKQLARGQHSAFYTLPILEYSPQLTALIEQENKALYELYQTLPHLQDLKTKRVIRKKSQFKYEIQELPKNPLDIDFGKDSGCCVQVEKEGEIKGNGFTVPSFLLSKSIRLFAIYQIRTNGKKERIGFINGFDTQFNLNNEHLIKSLQGKVLALNSVELSSPNLAGGYTAIQAIVDYVKVWMTLYIEKSPQNYVGLSMGDLYYNHACRRQDTLNDHLQCELSISSYYKPIYSDIISKVPNGYCINPAKSYWWINPVLNLSLEDLVLSNALGEYLRNKGLSTLNSIVNQSPLQLEQQGLSHDLLLELKSVLGSLSLNFLLDHNLDSVA